MRGKKSGLETKLREKQPNLRRRWGHMPPYAQRSEEILLVIQKFCRETFYLHTYSKWSPDVHETIEERFMILDIPYKKPLQRISHRWLSVYQCVLSV